MASERELCLYCEDFLPKLCDQMDPWEKEFYDLHMSCHQHLRFICIPCHQGDHAGSVFDSQDEVEKHLRRVHNSQTIKIGQNVHSPVNVRRASCQTCQQIIYCRSRCEVIRHMLDHKVKLVDVPSENTNFNLGCRVCPYSTKNWNDWEDHFNSVKYFCHGSTWVIDMKRFVQSKASCSWCKEDFANLAELQRHYSSSQHLAMMCSKPKTIFKCGICYCNVVGSSFSTHLGSKPHKKALIDKLFKISKPRKHDAGKVSTSDQAVEAAINDLGSFSISGSRKSSIVVTSRESSLLDSSKDNTRSRASKQKADLHCPFCSDSVNTDLRKHICAGHQGDLFRCGECPDFTSVFCKPVLSHICESHSSDADVHLNLPVNHRFFMCKTCERKDPDNTLKVSHVDRTCIMQDHKVKFHSKEAGSADPFECVSQCRICQGQFDTNEAYFVHPCRAALDVKLRANFKTLNELLKKCEQN